MSDLCGCDDKITDGVFSLRVEHGDMNAEAALGYRLARSSYEEFQRAVRGNVAAKYYFFGFSGGMSSDEYRAHAQALAVEFGAENARSENRDLIERFGDPEVLRYLRDCKLNCHAAGLLSTFTTHDDMIAVHVEYHQPIPESPALIVSGSAVEGGVTVAPSNVPAGNVFRNGTRLPANGWLNAVIRRAKNTTAVVQVDFTSGMSVSAIIPKDVAPPPVPLWGGPRRLPGTEDCFIVERGWRRAIGMRALGAVCGVAPMDVMESQDLANLPETRSLPVDARLVRWDGSPVVFLIEGATKRPIASWEVFDGFGFARNNIDSRISADELARYSMRAPVTAGPRDPHIG